MSQFSARFTTFISALLTGYFLVTGNLLEDDRGVSLLLKVTAGALGIVTFCLLCLVVLQAERERVSREELMDSSRERLIGTPGSDREG